MHLHADRRPDCRSERHGNRPVLQAPKTFPAPKDQRLRDLADCIRFLSMDAVQQAKSGHTGMPMGMADIAAVLFSEFLKFDAADPYWFDRD
ncbi:hypothetical protein ACC771_14025, partial [Rhizobium ruizarguesonis]